MESRNDVAALGPEGGPPAGSDKGAGQPSAKRGVVAAQRGSVTSRCPLCVIHPAGGPPLLTRKCSCWIFVRFSLFHIFLSSSPKWKTYFVSCILVFDPSRTYSCVPSGAGLGVAGRVSCLRREWPKLSGPRCSKPRSLLCASGSGTRGACEMQQMSYLGAVGMWRVRRTRAWVAAPPGHTVTVTDGRPVPTGIAAVSIRVAPGRCAGIPSGTLLASPWPSHPHQEGRAQGQQAAGPLPSRVPECPLGGLL